MTRFHWSITFRETADPGNAVLWGFVGFLACGDATISWSHKIALSERSTLERGIIARYQERL